VAAGEVAVGPTVLVGASVGVANASLGLPAVFMGVAEGVLVVTRLQAEKTREMNTSIGKTIFLGKATFFHPVNCKIILPAQKQLS
jgi:predicted RecA/RadA family phage recombinase